MRGLLALSMAVLLGVYTARADIFTDTLDTTPADMDITQVEVTHDAASINFVITMDAAGIGLDAGKQFSIGFDTGAGGHTGANAWDYQPFMSSGMDFYSAGWSDGADYLQMSTYSAVLGGWPEWDNGNNDTFVEWTEPVVSGNTISLSISRAVLGLTAPDASFDFDVYTTWSGGSWTADGLGSTIGGSAAYDSTVNGVNTYVIPEPATLMLVLISGGGMLAIRRRMSI